MKKFILSLFGMIVLFSSPAYAMIIDLADVDGLGYFKDTNTGKMWMDVDNFSEVLTKNDYMTELFGTGFHLATLSEVLELQQSIPITPESFDTHFDIMGGSTYSIVGGALLCAGSSDGTITCPPPPEPRRAIIGFYDDGGGLEGLSISSWHSTNDQWQFDEFNHTPGGFLFGSAGGVPRGAFVVNSLNEPVVPEPATMLLLGGGLIGSLFCRRKKHSSSH